MAAVSAVNLAALIQEVATRAPDAEVVCNDIGNLAVMQDGDMVAWVDFGGNEVCWVDEYYAEQP